MNNTDFALVSAGALIRSNKPIAAFSGNDRVAIDVRTDNTQDKMSHIVEQLIPTSSWGNEHYLIQKPDRRNSDLVGVLSLTGNNAVSD